LTDKIIDLLDIKLFMPASRLTAKTRRFSRNVYQDAPKGGRHPGQMWKTEGYFEGVAWVDYKNEHGFLFQAGDVEKDALLDVPGGIFVRSEIDAGIVNTVKWATDVILAELARKLSQNNGSRRVSDEFEEIGLETRVPRASRGIKRWFERKFRGLKKLFR